jgi:hypothetical protein
VKPTLYQLLVKAREYYDDEASQFICDCIMQAEDEVHKVPDFGYPLTREALDLISDKIQGKHSVAQFLFDKGQFALTYAEIKEAREYRELLWQDLFDMAAS